MPKPAEFIAAAHWARGLEPGLRERAIAETVVRPAPAGTLVCRKGEAVEHWIGVVDGLVKMANVSLDGRPTSFTGIPSGGWFGEGSLLKDEPRRYDIVALRESTIAYMPRATFMALLDGSVAFNRFLLVQLNERLGQFIAMVEHDRLLGPDARLARGLAALFNPHLYPGIGATLPISQEEIGQLVGLSRQRVNQALKRLQQRGLLRVEYGGVTVLDLEGLRRCEDR
ncbi:MAG: Crp/Fnr family transcriptional regulator [Betaproteobacteria bacterium]|jgi:CRP/FNR family cyclic AMP-dependent transcriptional regulator|nr:Crp/Fnr family transcriptional regulator [Betaproteobacteria bacterium]